ncbi:MAG: response regulator transcription factor [Bacteroidota bacterium]
MTTLKNSITIVLLDDHPFVLEGLKKTLENNSSIKIIGTALNPDEAFLLVKKSKPDVLVADISIDNHMFLKNELESGMDLLKAMKGSGVDTPVIFFTMFDQTEVIIEAIRNGVSGYIIKNSSVQDLATAIRKVAKGGEFFDEVCIRRIINTLRNNINSEGINVLSNREKEVLKLLGQDLNSSDISKKLGVSKHTVEAHKRNMIEKLELKGTAELYKIAKEKYQVLV